MYYMLKCPNIQQRIMHKKYLGRLGENVAIRHLRKAGFRLLGRNLSYKKLGEIDLVASRQRNVHFIEVKTQKYNRAFHPQDIWSPEQQRRLIKLAGLYLSSKNLEEWPWQIDLIAITFHSDENGNHHPKIEHLENVLEDPF